MVSHETHTSTMFVLIVDDLSVRTQTDSRLRFDLITRPGIPGTCRYGSSLCGDSYFTGAIGMRQQDQAHRRAQDQKWIVPDPSSIATSPSQPICVFIADGQEVVRVGVCTLLEGERDLEVIGEADNAEDLLTESRRTKPDVVVLKSGLSGGLDPTSIRPSLPSFQQFGSSV